MPPQVETMRRFACGSARLNCARGTLSRDGSMNARGKERLFEPVHPGERASRKYLPKSNRRIIALLHLARQSATACLGFQARTT